MLAPKFRKYFELFYFSLFVDMLDSNIVFFCFTYKFISTVPYLLNQERRKGKMETIKEGKEEADKQSKERERQGEEKKNAENRDPNKVTDAPSFAYQYTQQYPFQIFRN